MSIVQAAGCLNALSLGVPSTGVLPARGCSARLEKVGVHLLKGERGSFGQVTNSHVSAGIFLDPHSAPDPSLVVGSKTCGTAALLKWHCSLLVHSLGS